MKIALVSVLVLLALTTAGCVVRHPSDSEFRRLFEERRDSFLRLAATLETDGITGRLAAAELRSRKDIPEEKKEILSRLFAVFGNRELVCIKRDDGSTLFLLSFRGIVPGGDAKGIAFIPRTRLKMFERVPEKEGEGWPRREGEFIKPLDGDWYLIYLS